MLSGNAAVFSSEFSSSGTPKKSGLICAPEARCRLQPGRTYGPCTPSPGELLLLTLGERLLSQRLRLDGEPTPMTLPRPDGVPGSERAWSPSLARRVGVADCADGEVSMLPAERSTAREMRVEERSAAAAARTLILTRASRRRTLKPSVPPPPASIIIISRSRSVALVHSASFTSKLSNADILASSPAAGNNASTAGSSATHWMRLMSLPISRKM
mmetsp:Transcript_3489/g.8720  ORF Transcript_3489/g.8720 Transcript_3489/m.8720 type:complete len:215 (+) Transcript_3489:413-1057(+)